MNYEKSCGAIIIDDDKVLLIKQGNGDWGFPKGHMIDGESEFAEGLDRDSFIEIADCHGKVRLHKSSDDSVTEFIQKLSVMCNEIDCFIKHLKTKLIDNETV